MTDTTKSASNMGYISLKLTETTAKISKCHFSGVVSSDTISEVVEVYVGSLELETIIRSKGSQTGENI